MKSVTRAIGTPANPTAIPIETAGVHLRRKVVPIESPTDPASAVWKTIPIPPTRNATVAALTTAITPARMRCREESTANGTMARA